MRWFLQAVVGCVDHDPGRAAQGRRARHPGSGDLTVGLNVRNLSGPLE